VSDPFRIEGPACISFSGGRTSAFMLRRILDAHGGALPENVHVLFANTGKERTETLDFVHECGVRWGVPIHWIEYNGRDVVMPVARAVIDGVVRLPHMEVTYDTASRNGEPFARLISERQYTPNVVTRFCTEILKIRAMKRWLMARGYEEWSTTVGLRADEMRRVTRITSPEAERERETVLVPLARAGITVQHIMDFWQEKRDGVALDRWLSIPAHNRPGWDLALRSYEGNCDLCFLKGRKKRERIMREHPELVPWWSDQEVRVKGTFHAHEPGYAKTLERVHRLPMLPMDLDPDGEDDSIPCTCTD